MERGRKNHSASSAPPRFHFLQTLSQKATSQQPSVTDYSKAVYNQLKIPNTDFCPRIRLSIVRKREQIKDNLRGETGFA